MQVELAAINVFVSVRKSWVLSLANVVSYQKKFNRVLLKRYTENKEFVAKNHVLNSKTWDIREL